MIYTRLDKLLRYLRIKKARPFILKDTTLCDIGCGSEPKLLFDLSDFISAGVGIDSDSVPEKYQLNNLKFKKEVLIDSIDMPDNSVDVVTMLAVIEHLENPKQIIMEANRILRKNGRIIITSPSKYNQPVGEFLSFKLGLINPQAYLDHKNYYTKNYLENLLKASGFRIIKSSYWEMFLNIFLVGEKINI